MKCSELSQSKITKEKENQETVFEELIIHRTAKHEFVSNGEGVNYSILLGQCAPFSGVRGGLDGTG